jgi:hypothetical protein
VLGSEVISGSVSLSGHEWEVRLLPPLFHVVERVSCIFRVFASLLGFLLRLCKLSLNVIEPRWRAVSLQYQGKQKPKTYRSIAFMFGVIRSISALSFATDASNSPRVSPEESCSENRRIIRTRASVIDSVAVNAPYPSFILPEGVKVYFDAIIWHSPGTLCRLTRFVLFINVHRHLVA